ncbi:MAG TPA: FliI/YscN family ATPase, partial [Wenzhouxiangella sp.]|nr:FliI/YscN family ATPase [Wenzhouxiangella sp.]
MRALNVFAPICRGQRIGVFSGSGVGKSTLLSMLARGGGADVAVIGLIGERGREVQEFLQETLGEDGLKSTVMVVATSDESPQMRRQATYLTLAVAEAFRDMGMQALCLVDSVTRFAMAQREIGLTAGEPPTSKGYPPSVFSEMAKLLERAGPGGDGQGDITAIFTVLAEGDDHNDPIADAARSILDGHIVLERAIAERGRFPAIDILKSVSRALPGCHSAEEFEIYREARRFLAAYEEMRELIRLGAYKAGSDPVVDRAIELEAPLEAFLAQTAQDSMPLNDCFAALAHILGHDALPDGAPEEAVSGEAVAQAGSGEAAVSGLL